MPIAQRGTLSVDETADYLGLSRSKTWTLVSGGTIPSFHVGRNRLVSVEQLQEWIRRQERVSDDQPPAQR